MKSKAVLLMIIAGLLAMSACSNPIIEKLIQPDEIDVSRSSPDTPEIPPAVTYTVTFESNGGSQVDSQDITEGDTASRPENPEKDGFGFVNWYDNEELAEPHFDFDTPVTGDMCLYAHWSETFYTVTFMDGGTVLAGLTRNAIPHGSTVSRPETNPAKVGYTFDNWYSNSGLTTLFSFSSPITVNTTVYAKFNIKSYTVTFMECDETEFDDLTQTVPYGSTVERPDYPQRDGYAFDGWYADWLLTLLYDFENTPVTGDITLYAGLLITDAKIIKTYLDDLPGETNKDDPVPLRLALDLGDITTQTGSNWWLILNSLFTFIDLDLSACTMNGTLFDPISGFTTGKKMIVSIALPDAATSIVAFGNFTVLKSFSGTGLKTIGSSAFNNCTNLAMTTLPAEITSIGDSAFVNCQKLALTSLPAGLTSIGNDVFYRCTNLALTSLPAGIVSIGNRSFSGCTNLALTSLPAGIISIGTYAFDSCTNLALISLPAELASIGDDAFYGCTKLALTSLPDGLTKIGDRSFQKCTKLAQISLPAGITSIGISAFDGCTNLLLVTCPATTPPTLGGNVFNSTNASLRIEVPAESVDDYKNAANWSVYAERIFAIGG